jgi:hypothetical protein
MATSSGAYLTHDSTRKQLREDLLDIITDLSPTETPLFTGLDKGKADGVFHEFLEYSVSRASGISASTEGEDDSFSALSTPSRNINFVQEITKPYKVSWIQAKSDNAGGDELARRRSEAMKNWKLAFEYSLINGSGNSGASNTARVMKGLLVAITTNVTNFSAASMTETKFNDFLQMAWNNAEDDTFEAYLDMRLKRVVSGYTAGLTKNINSEDKRLINQVDIYESDVAKTVKLFAHRELTGTSKFFAIQPRAFKIAMFTNPMDMDVPSQGNWTGGKVYGAGTLEYLYQKAGLIVNNIA